MFSISDGTARIYTPRHNILVRLGDDNTLHVYQSSIAILVLDSVTTIKIVALYVPEFRLSLLSVSQLAAQKYTTMFTSEFCLIHDEKKYLILAHSTCQWSLSFYYCFI
jgi:hypothetical protein